MTLDEKLDIFYKSAIEDATKQSVSLIEEYKKTLDENFKIYKTQEISKEKENYRIESAELLRNKNKQISDQRLFLKREITQKTEQYKNTIFELVQKKLDTFMKTSEYTELLIKQISFAIKYAKGTRLTLYINPTDQSKQKKLEVLFHHDITISKIDFIGGTRAVISERNILIDNSFATKLLEEKNSFMFK